MGNIQNMSASKQALKDKLMAIILLETSKDYKEMDDALVSECVDFLMELEGKEKLTRKEIEQRVKEIPFKGKVTAIGSYTKRKIRAKRLAVIAAVLAAIIALFGIIGIASGNSLDEIFRQFYDYIFEMPAGSSMEYDNISFIKPTETKTYSSIEELIESEEIDILCPAWLPENEKIITVWYTVEEGVENYVFQFATTPYGVTVVVDKDLSEEVKENSIKKEIAGLSVYYQEFPEFFQANFVYKNSLYYVKYDTEDNLFRIIENLKEIN